MKLAPAVLGALAVILALVVARECGYHEGAKQARAEQRDARTDTVIVNVGAAYRDSMNLARRENARLRAKVAPRDSIVLTDTVVVYRELAGRDSVIVYLDSTVAYLERQVAIRDSLVAGLQSARNAWRDAAQRPRYTVTDIGGGAIAGYGLAERNETAVLVGAGVVLVPRLLGVVRRLF